MQRDGRKLFTVAGPLFAVASRLRFKRVEYARPSFAERHQAYLEPSHEPAMRLYIPQIADQGLLEAGGVVVGGRKGGPFWVVVARARPSDRRLLLRLLD
jgi:hypothetical protein